MAHEWSIHFVSSQSSQCRLDNKFSEYCDLISVSQCLNSLSYLCGVVQRAQVEDAVVVDQTLEHVRVAVDPVNHVTA